MRLPDHTLSIVLMFMILCSRLSTTHAQTGAYEGELRLEACGPDKDPSTPVQCCRVDIFHNGRWGTVCDDHWNQNPENPNVVCKQLGCAFGGTWYENWKFNAPVSPIDTWLDEVQCQGTEERLTDCAFSVDDQTNAWENDCSGDGEDVGVCCSGVKILSDKTGICAGACPPEYDGYDTSSVCIKCATGEYWEDQRCKQCDNGYFQVDCDYGGCKCIACPKGTAKNFKLPETAPCDPCPINFYSDTEGVQFCTKCPAGKYTDGTHSTSITHCKDCPPGKKGDQAGADCRECYPGFYSSAYGATACIACASDHYQEEYGQTTCLHCSGLCGDGFRLIDCGSIAGTSAGTCQCAAGNYISGSSCLQCAAGTYSDATDVVECTLCASGKYQTETGKTECVTCENCPSETSYATGVECGGSSAGRCCAICEENQYLDACEANSPGQCYTCKTCAVGQYNEGCTVDFEGGCVNCTTIACGPNQYKAGCDQISPGQCTNCDGCPAGKYRKDCGELSAGTCEECASGTYKSSDGTEPCTFCSCEEGKYLHSISAEDELGRTFCDCRECPVCEAGKYRVQCSSNYAGICIDCPEGKYKTDTSTDTCLECGNCPLGSYLQGCEGAAAGTCEPCEECSDGFYRYECTSTSAGSCTPCLGCAEGSTRIGCQDQSSGECEACATGKYKSFFGSEACQECSCSLASQYHKIPCGGAESGTCAFCEAGKYLDTEEGACFECNAGTYSLTGAIECNICSHGKYSLSKATACLNCEPGKYALTSATTCDVCQAGTFAGLPGASACQNCAPGRYSAAMASICSLCNAGTYATEGSAFCSDCVAGTFSGRSSASCFSCPAGTYADTIQSTQCTACPLNTFSTQEGATTADTCNPCGESLYAPQGASTCSSCGAGALVQEKDGVETCEVCPLQTVQASASRFGETCPVTCVDNACVKSFITQTNITRNVSMREHIAAVYGVNADIENALMAIEGTWEYTQLETRVAEFYYGNQCTACADIVDPIRNQVVPREAYSVNGATGSCTPTCNTSLFYFARSQYPGTCVLCDLVCNTGEYLTDDACQSCVECVGPVQDNWNFTGRGQLDDESSCPWACNEGFFLDYVLETTSGLAVRETCLPHTVLTCNTNEYQVRGTNVSDTYCEECQVSCEGRKQASNCSQFADATCTECSPALATLETGATYVGNNCTRACSNGYVLNKGTGRCEFCATQCKPGFFAPAERQNCTDCQSCQDVLPVNASYIDACTWACDEGFAFAQDACISLSLPVQAPRDSELSCQAGERLVWKATFFACESCDVALPAAPVDSTWRWLPSRSACIWECLPGYYRAPISTTLVDCLTWEAYEMQIIKGASSSETEEQPAAVSATVFNNVQDIEFRQQEREYETLSITEFGLLAAFIFGTLMLLVLTQT